MHKWNVYDLEVFSNKIWVPNNSEIEKYVNQICKCELLNKLEYNIRASRNIHVYINSGSSRNHLIMKMMKIWTDVIRDSFSFEAVRRSTQFLI